MEYAQIYKMDMQNYGNSIVNALELLPSELCHPYELTHLSLVPHICIRELGQHRFR